MTIDFVNSYIDFQFSIDETEDTDDIEDFNESFSYYIEETCSYEELQELIELIIDSNNTYEDHQITVNGESDIELLEDNDNYTGEFTITLEYDGEGYICNVTYKYTEEKSTSWSTIDKYLDSETSYLSELIEAYGLTNDFTEDDSNYGELYDYDDDGNVTGNWSWITLIDGTTYYDGDYSETIYILMEIDFAELKISYSFSTETFSDGEDEEDSDDSEEDENILDYFIISSETNYGYIYYCSYDDIWTVYNAYASYSENELSMNLLAVGSVMYYSDEYLGDNQWLYNKTLSEDLTYVIYYEYDDDGNITWIEVSEQEEDEDTEDEDDDEDNEAYDDEDADEDGDEEYDEEDEDEDEEDDEDVTSKLEQYLQYTYLDYSDMCAVIEIATENNIDYTGPDLDIGSYYTIEYEYDSGYITKIVYSTIELSESQSSLLEGIGFKLYFEDEETWVEGTSDDDYSKSYVSNYENATTYTTDENGSISLTGLKKGTYRIYEIEIDVTLNLGYYLEDQIGYIYDSNSEGYIDTYSIGTVYCGYIDMEESSYTIYRTYDSSSSKNSRSSLTSFTYNAYNDFSGTLQIEKLDEDTENPLSNSSFKLFYAYDRFENYVGAWVTGYTAKTYNTNITSSNATTYTTTENGTVSIPYLRLGTYYIYECSSTESDGYYLEDQEGYVSDTNSEFYRNGLLWKCRNMFE